MNTDEMILMSKFEKKTEECNSIADLENLCEKFLKFRKKYPEPQIEQKAESSPFHIEPQTVYIGPGSIETFGVEHRIDERDLVFRAGNKPGFMRGEIVRDLGLRLLKAMDEQGYLKIDEEMDPMRFQRIVRMRAKAVKL